MVEYSALIIDDDIWMQRILSKTLASYGFKKSYLAGNGIEGIALAIEHKPTICFLDIMLPELSGHIVTRILKRIKIVQHIPIIMVSALSDVENLGLTVKYGASGYITKPFTRVTIYDKLLDIFGKQTMDYIMRGDKVDSLFIEHETFVPHTPLPNTSNDENFLKTNNDFLPPDYNSGSGTINTKKAEQINQHYQEDDKKNLDAIRKMLLKNRG
ncbi:MAG TPA: response regulator [Candidatus Kapabacteria bacterium]|nr:response regulator [Candidatus Kapabacteria bacterium]